VISAQSVSITLFRSAKNDQRLEIELLGKYTGRQYLDNTSDEDRSIDPFYVNDLKIRYTIHPKGIKELGAMLSLNNVFDRMYSNNGYTFSYIYDQALTTQNYYYPQAGFNWLLGVNFKW
jgi:iron complex outermembrane recepter protein